MAVAYERDPSAHGDRDAQAGEGHPPHTGL